MGTSVDKDSSHVPHGLLDLCKKVHVFPVQIEFLHEKG